MSKLPQSCIYQGIVTHTRHVPLHHAFRYHIFLLFLDLAELDQVFQSRWLWSVERMNWAVFRRRDHVGDPSQPLDDVVRGIVEQSGEPRPTGPIRLLTHLRYCGVLMNPVSFYYCHDQEDKLQTVVAEVNNTPWGERHIYVVPKSHCDGDGTATKKVFHVSPFLPMDREYRWRITAPAETLSVHIEHAAVADRADALAPQGRLFDVRMELRRQPLDGISLAKALARHPCMTLSVLRGIYWQALRLWWRQAPFFPHPGKPAASVSM